MMFLVEQDHHYVPQVYLRQWCVRGRLLRYRRVGPTSKLVVDQKSPKRIAFQTDLYTLPAGGVANGLSGRQIESTLASTVDQRLKDIVERASSSCGRVSDKTLEKELSWLMQTFSARSPTSIERVEAGVAQFIDGQRATIETLVARANLQSTRDQLRGFQDPRRPKVAALAGIAAVALGDVPSRLDWLDGDVHVLRAVEVQELLRGIGAGEFVTFEDPVVEWESSPGGPVASFALSPAALLVLLPRGRQPTLTDYCEIALRHSLVPLTY